MLALFKNHSQRQAIIFLNLYFFLIIITIIPFQVNTLSSSKESSRFLLDFHSGEITVKIVGTGPQFVVSENYTYCPKSIKLNGVTVNPIENDCRVINIPNGAEENDVEISYDSTLESIVGMFSNLTNIIKVDLSRFDSSSFFYAKYMFYNCPNLNSIILTNFDTSSMVDIQFMFYDCTSLVELDLSSFDTSKVQNMDFLVRGCTKLKRIDLSSFVTSNLERLQGVFEKASALEKININHFDTSKVTVMNLLFCDCESLTSLDLSNFKTSLVNNMEGTFLNCKALTTLDLSSFDPSQVTNMNMMFSGCVVLSYLNLPHFNTQEVVNMHMMFASCKSLTTLDLASFNTLKVTDMYGMFYDCSSLITLDLSSFNTPRVTNMYMMFYNCESLTNLDLQNFDTREVLDMHMMFYNCKSLTYLDLSSFNTPKVTDMYMMFSYCNSLTSLDITNFNTIQVKTIYAIFAGCEQIKELDLSFFNTSNVEDMSFAFYRCISMTSVNVSNFDASKGKSLDYFFYDCYSLSIADLSNFNTKNIESMNAIFHYCRNLKSLNLSSFNTESVVNMFKLFHHCEALVSLDVSNFNVEKVTDMQEAFMNCEKLVSLDLSSFNPVLVTNMGFLFYYCLELRYINLMNFHTNSATNMEAMFGNCIRLTSLDLSSFVTSHVKSMKYMFFNCPSLSVIDMSSFDTSSLTNAEWMLQYNSNIEYINFKKYNELNHRDEISVVGIIDLIIENIVICIEEDINVVTKFRIEIDKKACPTIDCSGDYKAHQKKLYYEADGTISCAQDCSGFKYENNNRCYSSCPVGADFCRPEDDIIPSTNNANEPTTNIKSNPTTNIDITPSTNIDITPSTNIDNNPTTNINNNPATTDNIITTNNNEEENIDSTNIESSSNLLNKKSNTITSFPSIHTEEVKTTNEEINEETTLMNKQTNAKSDKVILIHSDLLQSSIVTNILPEEAVNFVSFNITGDNNQEIYMKIVNDLIHKFIKSNKDSVVIEAKNDFIYQITTSDSEKESLSQKISIPNKSSSIDLGECENKLKDHYNLDRNVSLILLKFEKMTTNSSERNFQYEIYEPYNLTKLDLTICKDIKINMYTHVELSEELLNLYNEMKKNGYNLFDKNDAFYRDICTPFTTPNGTDVLLDDRMSYYYHNNELVCQSNCEFSDYDIESQLLKCECDVRNSEINTKEITKITKKTIYQSFYDTLKFSNYKVLYCYKLAFHINSVTVNKGSIMAIIYFCFYFCFMILYFNYGKRRFKVEIARLIFLRNKNENEKIIEYKHQKHHHNIMTEKQDKKGIFPEVLESEQNKFGVRSSTKTLISRKSSTESSKFKNIPPKKNSVIIESNLTRYKSSNNINSYQNNEEAQNNKDEKLDNFELNNLDFDDAIKLDKRSFISTYWAMLKREHLVIFTFLSRNDHNLIYVKLARFIFLIASDMAFNVFFFSDETMHKMFLDYGEYNFLQQISQIVYSTVASQIIEVFLCFLSMTDKHYYEIKHLDYDSRKKIFEIIKCVKRKLVVFFVFTFLLFAFYWYAIACFCAVYVNTQNAFIIDSISSFALSLLYPFVLYLFPVLFRIISLRATKAKLSCLYDLSDVIPFF